MIDLKKLPSKCGVYLFYDYKKNLIYIGKAKNISKRVAQHFKTSSHKNSAFKNYIKAVDYILVKNEKEALLLEINLIKKHQPRFNVLFKDDKAYPYVCLKDVESGFQIQIKRNYQKKDQNCFGPYHYGSKIIDIVRVLEQILKTKKCHNKPQAECLYYQMNQCQHLNTKEEEKYFTDIKAKIINFLKGDVTPIVKIITSRMMKASNNEEYEIALKYKNLINKIRELKEEQKIVHNQNENADYIGYYKKDIYITFFIMKVRFGIIIMTYHKSFETFQNTKGAIKSFLNSYYSIKNIPYLIYLDKVIEFEKTELIVPKIGRKKKILIMAMENAKEQFQEEKLSFFKFERKIRIWKELENKTNILNIDFLEIYDASHIGGESYVGGKLEFNIDGVVKKQSRKYNLNDLEKPNDIKAIKKIMIKRFGNYTKIPSLILVDGGIAQINAVKEIIIEKEIEVPVFGLVKNSKHKTSHLINDKNQKIMISKDLLFYLTNIQDKIHNFTILYHTKMRKNNLFKSEIDQIKGVGIKTKIKLFKHYQEFEDIKNATEKELSKIVGIRIAKMIKKWYN